MQNIVPPQECPIESATKIVNFYSPKKEGALIRKPGLRKRSEIQHSGTVTATNATSIDIFNYFNTTLTKRFNKRPTIISLETIQVGGQNCILQDTNIVRTSDQQIVGSIDFWTGMVTLMPAADFSAIIAIKLNDPILGMVELAFGNGYQTYLTDGRSIFLYAEDASLSVASLPYDTADPLPAQLNSVWWMEEVFIKGTGTGRNGICYFSTGNVDELCPIFQFNSSTNTCVKANINLGSNVNLIWAKRMVRLRDRTFACGIRQRDSSGESPVTTLLETRVQWSVLGNPTETGAWDSSERTGAGFSEIDDIIEDASAVKDELYVSASRSVWAFTPSFTASAPVSSRELLDDFPIIRGFTFLRSRGEVFTINTRGIYRISETAQNISENAGVRIDAYFPTSRNSPNVFSVADEKEGVYYFHGQSDEEEFSNTSIVFSVENNSFSFFQEPVTIGKPVSLDDSFTFEQYRFIRDLNFRASQSRRFDAKVILYGDQQGNLSTRVGNIPGSGNSIILYKDSTNDSFQGILYIKGSGFSNSELNQVWKWDSETPMILRRPQDQFILSNMTQADHTGRWEIQENFEYESGQYNAFPERKRVVFSELRLFLRDLAESLNYGSFKFETFQRNSVLVSRSIDLSNRKADFLYSRWVKMLARSSGQSVGFRLSISEDQIFNDQAAFPFTIESSQFRIKR